MGRKKKDLSKSDMLYIDLAVKTYRNNDYENLFEKLASELDQPAELVRDYASRKTPAAPDDQLPPEPKPKELTQEQNLVRNLLTPNRLNEPNKARHVTVMSELGSETIEKGPVSPSKGSSRTKSCIFRQ